LGGLPLLRQESVNLTEQRLLEMDAVLIELLQLIEAAEDQ